MTDDLHSPLSTALQDRVRDEHPDLDELVRVSTARGSRLRRQRRVVTAVGVLTGTAAASACVLLLSGTGSAPSGESGIATQPSTAASPADATSPDRISLAELEQRLDRIAHRAGRGDGPLSVAAPGWDCDPPADEKIACSRGAAFVSVNWRPADERDAYLDPGKADATPGVHTFVSPAHGRWFATVSPGEGATQVDVDQVAAGITWKD